MSSGAGLTKTIKPLPFAQCPETGFDLNADGNIDVCPRSQCLVFVSQIQKICV